MGTFINILIVLSLLSVLVTLGAGIYSMVRGGEFNERHGNRLMGWRVKLQAVAIGVLVIGFWYKSQHP